MENTKPIYPKSVNSKKYPGIIFKQIPSYVGYFATNDGRIYSEKSNKFLAIKSYENSYAQVGLFLNKKRETHQVHILIAKAFHENPNKFPTVNHKNGNKLDNSSNNLEWSSRKGNAKHARENGLINPKTRRVIQMEMDGTFKKIFESASEAMRILNIDRRLIGDACSGRQKSAGGFKWKFESERTNELVDEKELKNTDIWKPIPQFPNYLISKEGKIYSKRYKQCLEIKKNNKGYMVYHLKHNGTRQAFSGHVLVAKAFIENLNETKNKVNHKNGSKDCNHVENLEWCTQKGNSQHAHDTGLNKSKKKVDQFTKNGKYITTFDSLTEAAKIVGGVITVKSISKVCRGECKTTGGFIWKYSEKTD